MNELSDLYNRITQMDEKLLVKWQRAVNKRVRQFVRNVASASPFIDKPNKRMFGVRNSKDGQSLTIYGTSPNAGRMKGFNAPVDKWMPTKEAFHVFGEKGWRTIHKARRVTNSAGVPIQDVPYYGTSDRPDRYFGLRRGKVTLAYGWTDDGLALPVYTQDSYADWIMTTHRDEIDRIVLEAGQDVLSDAIQKGGVK